MFLLKYATATRAILGVHEATDAALLDAQRGPAESGTAYLLTTVNATARELTRSWEVVNGVAVEKTLVTLIGTPRSFVADGVAMCTVTVEPFVPCTLIVNTFVSQAVAGEGTAVALAAGDPTLVLTSDVPREFLIALMAMPGYWAAPLLVEAV